MSTGSRLDGPWRVLAATVAVVAAGLLAFASFFTVFFSVFAAAGEGEESAAPDGAQEWFWTVLLGGGAVCVLGGLTLAAWVAGRAALTGRLRRPSRAEWLLVPLAWIACVLVLILRP